MKTFLMPIVLTASLVFMSIADFQPNSPLRLGFVRNAEAIIGRPLTPMSYAGVARRSMYREAAVASTVAVTSAAAAKRCCREYGLRERCCGPGCCRKCCCCAGSGCERCCCRGRRPASCRWPAHRHDGAVAAPWMHLDGDRRGELFPVRRRLLPGRFSGKQRRVYCVSAVRTMSDECQVPRDFPLDTRPSTLVPRY